MSIDRVAERPATRRREPAVLALACAGSFVVIMDATIVPVALPDIRAELGFTSASLPWVVNAYTLAFAGFLLLGGRCADVFGQRRMFVIGMTLFGVARVCCGFAGSPAALLVARAVQGLGGALLMPVTLSLLTTTFTEPARRARVLGTWSAIGAVGAALGPIVGGVFTQWLGWRWVFFVSVPIGVFALVGAALVLTAGRGVRSALDVPGAAIATLGLVGVVYAVMRASVSGWGSASVLVPLVCGVVLLGVFGVHQARWAAHPLVPLSIFRVGAVGSGNVVMFLLGLGFFASPVLLSLYLREVHGYTPWQAGVGYAPIGVAMFVGAQLAAPLTVRLGARRAGVLCCSVGALGCLWLGLSLGVHSSYLWSVAVPGAVFGLGSAAAFTPITVAATSGVVGAQQGLAAGLLNTVRQTSGAIGLAVLATVAAAATGPAPTLAALAHGYLVAFVLSAAALATAAATAALTLPARPSR
ncbi:DHA2 family efflux MFS transporter permease subunit [Pseudonocardia spinosispora]|uniref:DHA2 family efflux MFS transporter permease subunit n=1 Tax=Pseudonocardia spinosispora TaxID=103441 RepID=UPI00041C2F08|nr:DHA2 family efflux MFS transporter permease subunit [Pseudonocardia spinosispora]